MRSLRTAGVSVTVDTVPGTMPGLLRAMDVCPSVREAFDKVAAAIRSHLSKR
jgi:hypothetical protein